MDSVIESYLIQLQPQSLLECSAQPWPGLEDWCRTRGIAFSTQLPAETITYSQPIDLALVHDALEGVDTAAGQQLLGHIRNSLARRIWLLVDSTSSWSLPTLTALGFRKIDLPFGPSIASYLYDLNSYNHKRSWNNSRFWANPENFNKFRW